VKVKGKMWCFFAFILDILDCRVGLRRPHNDKSKLVGQAPPYNSGSLPTTEHTPRNDIMLDGQILRCAQDDGLVRWIFGRDDSEVIFPVLGGFLRRRK
jgi:hypothetical protein